MYFFSLSTSIMNLSDALNGQNTLYPASSCAALPPSSPGNAGYYWVRASNGSELYPASSCAALSSSSPSGYYWVRACVRVYCDMARSCGGVTGGWMRVAYLDMTNSGHQCHSNLTQRTSAQNPRTCIKPESSKGCASVKFPPNGVSYSSVCGRILGYQIGTTNGFANTDSARGMQTINDIYVDGVSLTHGNPRQHIWTFAASLTTSGISRVIKLSLLIWRYQTSGKFHNE